MNLTYVKGDATDPQHSIGNAVIVHCCNDIGAWGAGFVMALSRKFGTRNRGVYESPQQAYLKWYGEKTNFKQGQIQMVRAAASTYVCNLIGQSGCGNFYHLPPIRYGAIEEGLIRLREWIRAKVNNSDYDSPSYSIHMPRMGCGLAGGEWEEIENIIVEVFDGTDIDITVYDFAVG